MLPVHNRLMISKKKKELLDNYLKQENFRGTIILSPEGINGTISFKIDRYISIKKNKEKIADHTITNS